jgi:tetratricopeptide (TPR) repeat protein
MSYRLLPRSLSVTTSLFKASVLLFLLSLGCETLPSATYASATYASEDDPLAKRAEYGITLALTGDVARAESVFISLLSLSPKDSRALTNLGNLHLMRGKPEVAIKFYDLAHRADSTDAGILLNRSIVLMLVGDDAASREDAARALRMTGGVAGASSLLGLRAEKVTKQGPKAAEKPHLSKEELLALLNAAASSVPSDSAGRGKGAGSDSTNATARTTGRTDAKPRTWRLAGPRAAELSDLATSLYWKR